MTRYMQAVNQLLQETWSDARADLDTVDGSTTSLDARVTTAEGSITSLDTRIDAIEELGHLYVRDEKADGTAGGNAVSGSWTTRVLNTVVANTIAGASVDTGTYIITLPPGNYRAFCRAPARALNDHKARLYDVTNSTTLLLGSNAFSASTATTYATVESFIIGPFTLEEETEIRLEHRFTTTRNGDGLGRACSFGVVEVYSELVIVKIG